MSANSPQPAKILYQQAFALHQQGRIDDARSAYERVLRLDPRDAGALSMLGVITLQMNDAKTALAFLSASIESDPSNVMAYVYRGMAHSMINDHESAIDSYDRALAIDSESNALPHFNRANALLQLGRYQHAVESYDRAIELESDLDGEACYEKGVALQHLDRHSEALASFDRALQLQCRRPAEAHFHRGIALISLGRLEEARTNFAAATGLNPNNEQALYNLGRVNHDLGNFDEARSAYEAAIGANRDFVDAHINLGMLLKDCGEVDAAIECFRRARQLNPRSVAAQSNLAFALMFTCESPPAILAECRLFDEQFALGFKAEGAPVKRRGDFSGGRLRIGYVSPDFKDHCQSFFTLPLLENHDHSVVEIFCYSSVKEPDGLTQRIARLADRFREVGGLDDEALASLIREDRIDILVDLTMHMGGGRPLLFARRPAPVQVAWLAYPGTTGMRAIDYRFSDSRLDPPDFDGHYSECTVRLPDAFWCYDPLATGPAVNVLPALTRGRLTLGCLNNPCKLTDRTLRLWAPALSALPDSRLLIMFPPGKSRERLLRRVDAAGIDPANVVFVSRRPRGEYLLTYHDIDLCLDTLPYNGHTTSLDSLWMGVPFVSRAGPTCVGRAGLSILHQLGLTELVAESDEDFAATVIALASDLQRLSALRAELRGRLQNSPLMDGRRFAANVEAAYRWAQCAASSSYPTVTKDKCS